MEKTYGGHTVAALREFLQHGDDTGETIDELTGDESSSANIIRDLLDGIPSDAAQAPIYQYRMVSGEWIDFPEQDGRMHIERGHTVRIVYAAPVAHQAAEDAAQAPAVPVELLGVEDELKNGDGFWRTCSGCHETDDGHPVGDYPFSAILNCDLGSGCSECGGIGAVWDNTDYGAMADAWDAQEIAREQAEEALAPIDYDRVVQICEAHGICLPVDCVEMVVEIIRHAAPVAPAAGAPLNGWKFEQHHAGWMAVEPNGRCHVAFDRPECEETERVLARLCAILAAPTPTVAADAAASSDDLHKAVVSLELTAMWLDGGCDPARASAEIRATLHRIRPLVAAAQQGGTQS